MKVWYSIVNSITDAQLHLLEDSMLPSGDIAVSHASLRGTQLSLMGMNSAFAPIPKVDMSAATSRIEG